MNRIDESEEPELRESAVPLTVPAATAAHLRDPLMACALGFGSGLSRIAPGTVGTVVGVALYLVVFPLAGPGYSLVVALAAVAGIPLCTHAARKLDVHDDPAIVWDEIAGFLVVMLGVPFGPGWIVAGFVLFRVLDITKPWPINVLDRSLPDGLGIMADDLLAGLVACGLLHGFRVFFM